MGLRTELKLCYYKLKYFFKFGSSFFKDDQIFANKRIIVIGAADSSMNYLTGEEIDKFDLIVRINNTPLVAQEYPESLGSRTDILFHCLGPSPKHGRDVLSAENLQKHKTQYVLFPEGRRKTTRKFYKFALENPHVPVKRLGLDFWKEIIVERKCKFPTTGSLALTYLLKQNFKELHITGFTFYRTNYVNSYESDLSNKTVLKLSADYHEPDKDFIKFIADHKKAIELGKKVFLDPVLEKIISDFTGKKLSNEGLKPLLQDEKLVSKGKVLESVG